MARYFPSSRHAISLHLCDARHKKKVVGESRMMQRPTKRLILDTVTHLLTHCTQVWWGAPRCGGIILHEFTHNQSAQSSDTTLEAPFGMWGRRINIQQWVAVAQDSFLFTPEKRFYSYLANQSSVLLQSI